MGNFQQITDMWNFKGISEMWEYRTGAITEGADKLAKVKGSMRTDALMDLANHVHDFVEASDDQVVLRAAIPMVDDMYKSLFTGAPFRFDDDVAQYIANTAGLMFGHLEDRGYQMRFVVNNVTDGRNVEPALAILQLLFSECNVVFISPQSSALQMMERRGHSRDPSALPDFIDDAQSVTTNILEQCQQDRRPYVFASLQAADGPDYEVSFAAALRGHGAPGVLTIVREEAPVEGTKVTVLPPEGIKL